MFFHLLFSLLILFTPPNAIYLASLLILLSFKSFSCYALFVLHYRKDYSVLKLLHSQFNKLFSSIDKKYRVLSFLSFTSPISIQSLSKQTHISIDKLSIILDMLAKERFAEWRDNGIYLYSISGFVRYKQEKRCKIISFILQLLTLIVAIATLYFTIK